MAVSMEKGGVEGRNRDIHTRGSALSLVLICIEAPFLVLQFIGPEVRNILTKSHILTHQSNLYSARTLIDNFIKTGSDEPMG